MENLRTVRQMLKNTESAGCWQCLMYQQLQKICRENLRRINVFRANLGNSSTISFAPRKICLLLHLCMPMNSIVDLGWILAVYMGVGMGAKDPGILKISAKRVVFLIRVGRNKFHHFWPSRKLWRKSPSAPPEKNSSDVHSVYRYIASQPLTLIVERIFSNLPLQLSKALRDVGFAHSDVHQILYLFLHQQHANL